MFSKRCAAQWFVSPSASLVKIRPPVVEAVVFEVFVQCSIPSVVAGQILVERSVKPAVSARFPSCGVLPVHLCVESEIQLHAIRMVADRAP